MSELTADDLSIRIQFQSQDILQILCKIRGLGQDNDSSGLAVRYFNTSSVALTAKVALLASAVNISYPISSIRALPTASACS